MEQEERDVRMKRQVLIPIQPFMILLSDTYYKKVFNQYGISHFYTCLIKEGITEISTSIPDCCVDLMFYWNAEKTQCGAELVGSLLSPHGIRVREGYEYFGIRFQPGIMPAMVSLPLGDVLEQMLPLSDFIPNDDIIEQIGLAESFEQRIQIFLNYYIPIYMQKEQNYGKQQLSQDTVGLIMQNRGNIRIGTIAEELGYSKQYVARIFTQINGISPKQFSEIIRFQMMVQSIECSDALDTLYDFGFYDQAHFCNEFRRLSGRSPREFLQELKQERVDERLKVL